MTLFDGKPLEADNNKKKKVILCASRMTDMPGFYPAELIEEVEKRINKGVEIHSLVLVTKHPRSIVAGPLKPFLLDLKHKGIQISAQITITGMGGLVIGRKANGKPLIPEPNAPFYKDSLSALPGVIDVTGSADRVRIRFDPIVRLSDGEGKIFSNLKFMPVIVHHSSRLGIRHFNFSFLEEYAKVKKRFRSMGCTIIPPAPEEKQKFSTWVKSLESKYDIKIYACCVPGFKESSCIDGRLLQETHPCREPADISSQPKRKLCGCTRSVDIGGWPPKKCFTGCDYCYAHPVYPD